MTPHKRCGAGDDPKEGCLLISCDIQYTTWCTASNPDCCDSFYLPIQQILCVYDEATNTCDCVLIDLELSDWFEQCVYG